MPETPPQPIALGPTPVIHVMPDKYIGAPVGKPSAPSLVGQAPPPPPAPSAVEGRVAPIPPPIVPPPTPGGVVVAPKKKKGKKLVVLIFFILLLGLSAGAVYFFGPFRAPEPPVVPVPVNRNRNVNRNVNENVNVNENLNVNANVNVNQNVNVPLRSGPDADSDGLTDTEEKALYRTNPNTQDSDADSFNDGNEVFHLFDPTKPAPSMLVDSGLVSLVVNSAHRYQILVPAGWGQRGNESAEFFATAPSGEFIEVLVTEKPAAQSLLEWLAAISPGTKAEEVERFRTKNDYDALRSPDRLTAYIEGGVGKVYAVTYNVDDRTDIDFRTTYEMMIASFMLVR